MVKVVIFGTRTFDSRIITYRMMCELIVASTYQVSEVVSGTNGKRKPNGYVIGVDKMGEVWAERNGIAVTPFHPNWRPDGVFDPDAGFARNTLMAEYAECGLCFWDGKSKGTADMFKKLVARRKPVLIRVVKNGEVYDLRDPEALF